MLSRAELKTHILTLATDICRTDSTVHAIQEMHVWGGLIAALRIKGCNCPVCGEVARVARLAYDGYRARYMELMEVA